AGDAKQLSRFEFHRRRPQTILVGADRPDSLRLAKVRTSTCEVKVIYGKEKKATIPAWGGLKYPIRTSDYGTRGDEVSSTEATPEHEAEHQEHGVEHSAEHGTEHSGARGDDHSEPASEHEARSSEQHGHE